MKTKITRQIFNVNFMVKKIIFFFVQICFLHFANAQTNRPNIIVFLVDDMGWQDCSVAFYKEKTPLNALYKTPNMERLAVAGMKFTNAYGNQNCTPTRISLMTGMNPVNHGVNSWTFEKNISPEEKSDQYLKTPQWNMNGFSPFGGYENTIYATPLPVLLKQGGYTSIHSGKAHFGAYGTPGSDPLNLGFDVNVGGTAAGQPASYLGIDSFGNKKNNPAKRAVPGLQEYWGKDIFLTEALTQKTLSVLDSVRTNSKPFFLYFSQFAVHTPLQVDKRFIQKYYDAGLDSIEAKYAAMIEGMDKSLGDVMDYLKKNKLSKNTVIIFLSDNGGLTDVVRGGNPNVHNSPARSGKTSGYDGGLRVPMIVSWPGVIKENAVCNNNVIVEDVFTTIRNITGVHQLSTVQKVDGLNLIPLFKGHSIDSNRMLTWHHPHLMNGRSPDIFPFSAIRINKWKLIYSHTKQNFELYNTDDDIGEQHNLFSTNKKRAEKMAVELGKILKNGKAGMPLIKATGKTVPYPDEIKF